MTTAVYASPDPTDDVPAVYARISYDPDDTEQGVGNQVHVGRDLCRRNAWPEPQSYIDDDLSATYGETRPQYDLLLTAIRRGEVKRVVVFHLSRLWRNRTERAAGMELMREHGVSIVCVRGPSLDMSTAYGRAMAGVLGEFDTMEVEIKSERQLLANRARAEQGLPHVGGHRAFGYVQGGMKVETDESVAIRAACDALLAGAQLTDIAREWNAAGFVTARAGKPWRASSVRAVLMNPRNAGIRAHHGKEVVQAVWPAIVTEPTFRAVVAHLSHRDRFSGGSGITGQRLLTGVALCGMPGCGLTINAGGAQRTGPLYRCPSQRHFSRLAEPVDLWVVEHVLAWVRQPNARDLLVDSASPDRGKLRKQAIGLRARIKSTRREFAADDTMSPAELREVLSTQRARLDEVEAAMADAGRVDVLRPLIDAEDAEKAWDAYLPNRKRLVIGMLMTIHVFPPGRGARHFDPDTVKIDQKV